jgi:hypothetical protein
MVNGDGTAAGMLTHAVIGKGQDQVALIHEDRGNIQTVDIDGTKEAGDKPSPLTP